MAEEYLIHPHGGKCSVAPSQNCGEAPKSRKKWLEVDWRPGLASLSTFKELIRFNKSIKDRINDNVTIWNELPEVPVPSIYVKISGNITIFNAISKFQNFIVQNPNFKNGL